LFGPLKVQYCLPSNIVLFVYIKYFEPNLVLVNVNKLKPYKYVHQTLKVSHSLDHKKSLESIDSNHMEKKIDENSKDHKKTKIIGTN